MKVAYNSNSLKATLVGKMIQSDQRISGSIIGRNGIFDIDKTSTYRVLSPLQSGETRLTGLRWQRGVRIREHRVTNYSSTFTSWPPRN